MSILRAIYDQLVEFYGSAEPENWWPEDPLEVIVGAILVPGSNWKIVAKILESLKSQGLLAFPALRRFAPEEIAVHIRPAGFQKRKSEALHGVLELIDATSGGDLARFFARNTDLVRSELFALKGVGPAVANNILLYAGKVPVYMVDPFTERILARHGITPPTARIDEVQWLVHRELTHETEPHGTDLYRSFQALVVRVGREYCEKTDPRCPGCPLQCLLPEGGPVPLPTDSCGRKPHSVFAPSNHARLSASPVPCVARPAPALPPLDDLDLDETERKIMERLDAERKSIDLVIEETGLAAHLVQSTLIGLEFRHLVRRCEGNTVARR